MKTFMIFLMLCLSCTVISAQDFDVHGIVVDEKGEPIPYAAIVEEALLRGTYTGEDGRFRFQLPKGRHTVTVIYTGYCTERRTVDVGRKTDTLVFEMKEETLMMDKVVVTAKSVDSKNGTSAYRVDNQAIQQIQAMSLNDIMSLLPGGKIEAPDFNSAQQANIRSAVTSSYNSFGTSVIVNGMALSNDANMQAANPSTGLGGGGSTVGGGIDLRSISAAGIQSVEVITGVPSAKYGNLASGAIIVESKVGTSPLYVSANVNATSYQGAVSKGFLLGRKGGVMNADLSYTYSQDSPVQRKNYYQNISFGARWMKQVSRKLDWNNTVSLQTYFGFNGQRFEPEEKIRNVSELNNQNINLSITGDMTFKKAGTLTYSLSGGIDNQYSHNKTAEAGPLPLVEALETGTYITGYSPILFNAEQIMKGLPVNFSANVDMSKGVRKDRMSWNFMTGIQYTFDKNFGEGRSIVGSVASAGGGIGARDANFYEVPASNTLSAYHETSMFYDGEIAAPRLRLGVRYDFMNFRYHLVAPRLSASVKLIERLRLRASWGLAYKAPAMIQLYPGPAYYDYTNLSYYATEPAERLAIVSTYVYQPTNEHLKPSHTNTVELGADLDAPWLNVRLTAYHKVLSNGISHSPELLLLNRQNYKVVDTPAGEPPVVEPDEGNVDILVREKLVMKNNMTETTDGLELTIEPPMIKPTHTEFNFQTSYVRTRQHDSGYYMQLSRYVVGDAKARYGVYDRAQYISRLSSGRLTVIQHIPALRLIFTLSAELNFVNYREPVPASVYPFAYYDGTGNFHEIPEEYRTSEEFADLKLADSMYEITDKKPFYANFHLQVRKEIKGGHSFSLYANNFLWYNPTYVFKETRRTLNGTVNFGFAMSFRIGGK